MFAWLKRIFHMTDLTVDQTAPVAPVVEPVPVAAPVVTVGSFTDLDKLKAILVTLGHDVTAVWDDAVALVQKAV